MMNNGLRDLFVVARLGGVYSSSWLRCSCYR